MALKKNIFVANIYLYFTFCLINTNEINSYFYIVYYTTIFKTKFTLHCLKCLNYYEQKTLSQSIQHHPLLEKCDSYHFNLTDNSQ